MSGTTTKKPAGPSQATRLVKLAFEQSPELFCDDDQIPFVTFQAQGKRHREVHALRSRAARTWLSGLYFVETGTAPGAQAIADSQNVLEAYASKSAPRSVYVRIARIGNDAIYLDLADPAWQVIEITPAGWGVVSRSPVPFRRPRGLAALPEPRRGGTLDPLWSLLTVTAGTAGALSADQILALAWLIGGLRGRGPYPILVSCGEQDAGKSTTHRILRSLVDPSVAPLRSAPRNEHDLAIAASNAHILTFDNLSTLKLSDELCRLASGAGFATRTLYENREEEIFCGARPIAMNGIVEIVERADLVSRSIFVQHDPIPAHHRLAEDQLWARFHAAHPAILGALLDILVTALQREQSIATYELPRMADFARFLVAAEPACPWPGGEFLHAYKQNRAGAVTDMLGDDPLVDCVRALVGDHAAGWSNTASALLVELNTRTPERLTKAKSWYQTPRSVANALRRLIGGLRTIGIRVTFDRGSTHRTRRLIHIERDEIFASAEAAGAAEPGFPHDSAVPNADDADATGEPPAGSADDADDSPDLSAADFASVYGAADDADDADDVYDAGSNWESED